jgi:multidrug efflux pump subunit AcrB
MKRDHKESFLKIQDFKYWLLVLAIIAIAGYATFNLLPANLAVFSILLLLLYVFVLQYAIAKFQEKIWPVFQSSYRNLVKFLISGNLPYLVPFITLGIFLLSIFVLIISKPKVEFFPDGEPNFVYIYNKMPMGTDANVTDSITQIIEKRVTKVLGPNHPDVNSVITNVGIGAGDPQNPDKVATPFKSKVTIAFKEYADRKDPMTSKILSSLQNEFKDGVAGAEISVEKDKKGPPVGKPINIEISGDDFAVLTKVTAELKSAIESSGIKGVNELKSDLQLSKPEIIIDINKEKMQREGLSLAQVAVEIRTALFGKEVSKYRDANDDAPIQLRLKEEYRGKVEELMQLNISFMDFATGSFRQVPISSLATLRYDNSLNQINRKNQRRVVTLSSDLSDGFAANEVIPDIQKIIDDIDLPEGYEMAMTGEQEQQAETGNFLVKAFGFAFALMLMIMVTQFNSLAKPLIIASSVLFSLIGVFFGNALFGMKVSVVMTGVGFFALAGIVIRNGILIIEFIDELRARGYAVEDAIVEAGYLRVTPVILTAVCTILGLIPLAIGLNIDFLSLFTEFDPKFYLGGDNVAFWGPLAWTMVYGLLVSTFLTLLVVPSIYMLGYKVKAKFRKTSQ